MIILSSYPVTKQPYASPEIDGRVIVHQNPDNTLGFTWQGGDMVAIPGQAIDDAHNLGITNIDEWGRKQGVEFAFGPFQLVTIGYDYQCDWLVARRKR